ncbi:MAG: response regulator transcription factor [Myxococcota bacterium]
MSGARILVVEDEESIVQGLKLNLSMEGYTVDVARDGASAVEKASQEGYDLVLLDLMLPRMNGFEVVEAVRKRGVEVPVLFLSARDAQADKVKALELGGDDYITKPFQLPELLARIHVALRRTRKMGDSVTFGEIAIDLSARRVERAGAAVELTSKEYDLLVYLLRSKGRALSRQQILERVWGGDYEGTERTVDNFVARLRNKLEKDPEHPLHIETVRGVGYRFEIAASPVTEP